MSYKRPDMKIRAESCTSANTATSPSSGSASPSPLSPNTATSPTSGYFHGRNPSRSVTIDTVFRRRSKSPKPLDDLPSASDLKHSKTSPASPTARHYSEGAIPSMADKKDSIFLKQKKQSGSMGPYGRHSNDWLFGGVSLTQTAKGLVGRRHDSK